MRTTRAVLAGLIGAAVPTSLLYTDGFWSVQLAVVLGVVSGVAGVLLYRHHETLGESARFSHVVFVVVLGGVPPFGMHAALPISSDLRIALLWLFLGFGIACWGIGCEMATRTAG